MKVLVAGDFCPQCRVADKFEKGDIDSVLGDVKPVLEQVDYSIVNFECPVTKGGEIPIVKKGPNLQCSEKGVESIKWAGFDCATLANNHFLDFGEEGVKNTLSSFAKNGIDAVGGGLSLQDASKTLYKEINGQHLAIINCCEHEFSIATETTAGSNPLNPIQQFYAIQEAKRNADYVIVIIHGGHEHFQLPSLRMQETYRFFIDVGADAVINHHQHCYSGYEVYNGKPIFYGLGNFCFDDLNCRNGIWTQGYMVELTMGRKMSYRIIPYFQCDEMPIVRLIGNDSFNTKLDELNSIISDSEKLREEVDKYYKSCELSYSSIFEPLNNRYYMALKCRGWLPSLIGKTKKLKAINYINCESHRDKLLHFLLK